MTHHPSPPSADAFRGFEKVFKGEQDLIKENLKREIAEHRREQVEGMIAGEITDVAWNELIDQARKAAERGEKQYSVAAYTLLSSFRV